ncbi:protein kinase domain-containing protein [Enterovirga rhinocerotis]|uniref:Serine/threonine protein kinase n=1 Tax=Enterovirga rhinocerotis TaxID=1339210 RepID=A0A4R7BVW2_9HYPH|nr:TIR domain-containing protein [Enterovirga rhinocerotis]TDR89593.1 serine/threonine protein kinase [Enterovirga rhinocerotis]
MADQIIAGRYRRDGEARLGGQATIFPAHDMLLGRDVAIKVARTDAGDLSVALRSSLIREARFLARMSHPGIVTLYDFFEVGAHVAFVMPRYRSNLVDELRRDPALRRSRFLTVFTHVADALDHCVASGVVHRDIKPANILLGQDDASICDFGVATEIDDAGDWTGIVGSHPYIAPELFLGDVDPDLRTPAVRRSFDQFALGVTVYQLLTGQLPFPPIGPDSDPRTSCTAINLLHHKTFLPCHFANSDLPPTVDDVVGRMLSVDPRSRFPTNRDAIEELRAALSGLTPGARRVFVSYARTDKPFVGRLVQALEESGRVEVRWDDQLVPGLDWDDQLEDAMVASDAMMVMLSRESVLSPEVKAEWRYWKGALERPLITVVLDDCRVPYRLYGHHQLRVGRNAPTDPAALASVVVEQLAAAVPAARAHADRLAARRSPRPDGNVHMPDSDGRTEDAGASPEPWGTVVLRPAVEPIPEPNPGAISASELETLPARARWPDQPEAPLSTTAVRRELGDYELSATVPGRLDISDYKTVIAGLWNAETPLTTP